MKMLCSHGHKVIGIEINKSQIVPPAKTSYMSWNTKKADWIKYSSLSGQRFHDNLIDGNSDSSEKRIRSAIFSCAKESIPRGKIIDYKPYWNDVLAKLTKERDEAGRNLESNWSIQKFYLLENCQKLLEEELIISKKLRFDEYVTSLDYRKMLNLHIRRSQLSMMTLMQDRTMPSCTITNY